MQNSTDKDRLAAKIRNKKYIDDYIDRWLKLETLDKPYVECEICSYISNASIHQHMIIPEELGSNPNNNRIIHLCANCYYEFRALIDRYIGISRERIPQMCEEAFEKLKDKKKNYRDMNRNLERVEI
ncbi:MAG: hypothetical protein OIN88_12510 [Candidatus Methanoperedens sp.]|nr:hypothetical protein [Candidatus Methanoperedens sp.]MCZ7358625.1 hypothetical protein [Candidatus Methanoperedens sp.]HLB71252.1 hypothetical protein [Candidatus Methanoperedens sp.]